MSACVFACADRREVRRTDEGEEGRKIGRDTRLWIGVRWQLVGWGGWVRGKN